MMKIKNRKFSFNKILFVFLFYLCLIKYYDFFKNFLWFDELATLHHSSSSNRFGLDSHLPLYYAITHFFLEWYPNDLILAAKLPSLLFSLLLLGVSSAYVIKREFSLKEINFFILLNYAAIEWVVLREARMYGMVFFVASLVLFSLLRVLKEQSDKNLALLFLSLLLGCSTFALFAPVAVAVWVILFSRLYTKISRSKMVLITLMIMISMLPIVGYYYFNGDKMDWSMKVTSWVGDFKPSFFIDYMGAILGTKYPHYGGISSAYTKCMLFIFVVFTIYLLVRRRVRVLDILLSVPVIVFILLGLGYEYKNLLVPRYLIILAPFFFFSLSRYLKAEKWSPILLVLTLLVHNIFIIRIFKTDHYAVELGKKFNALTLDEEENKIICGQRPFSNYFVKTRMIHTHPTQHCANREVLEYMLKAKPKKLYLYYYDDTGESEQERLLKPILNRGYKIVGTIESQQINDKIFVFTL